MNTTATSIKTEYAQTATKKINVTKPIMGGNIRYYESYDFIGENGEKIHMKPGIKISGIPGLKWPNLSLSSNMVETIIRLSKQEDFQKVLSEMKEQEE